MKKAKPEPDISTLAQRVRQMSSQLTAIASEIDDLVYLVNHTRRTGEQRDRTIGKATSGEANALREAVRIAGSYRALAEKLRVSHQAITQWSRCPASRVVDLERATGVPRERLRPDLFRK